MAVLPLSSASSLPLISSVSGRRSVTGQSDREEKEMPYIRAMHPSMLHPHHHSTRSDLEDLVDADRGVALLTVGPADDNEQDTDPAA